MMTAARGLRTLQRRAMSTHKAYVAVPEGAMVTKDGSHRFVRKGWEYSTYVGFVGGAAIVYFGLSSQPETDSRVAAREKAFRKLKDEMEFEAPKSVNPDGPIVARYAYERGEIGEAPTVRS